MLFLIGLINLDDSAFVFFRSFFLKIRICLQIDPKNVVSKNKANYKLFLVLIGKKYQEIIKINITKVFI